MAQWPLRGRESEISHLANLIADPDARGVVLSGPQGVGKTRLGLECLRIADDLGYARERVCATYATSTLPLGAVILSRPPQSAAAASPAGQAELVHRVAGDLVRQANGRRLVVLVDDVQWLDQLSAVFVHQLAATNAAFVVLTARTGAPAPEPIVALWKDELIERMSISPLDRSAIEPLLSSVLGGPVAGAVVEDLVVRSEGNLLFLREQVLAAVEEGSLTRDAGVWRLGRSSAAQPRLVELMEHRLAGLAGNGRACLEVVAFGEPLDLADLETIVGAGLVQELETRGLVALQPDGWGGVKVGLAHPLIGEVLRAETSVIRSRSITCTLAETAEARHPTQPDELLRIATWRLVCGGGTPDLMYNAAKAAFSRHDHELAAKFAQSAVAAGAGFEAQLLLAEAIGFATGERERVELDLAALAAHVTSSDQLAAVAHARMVNAHLSGNTTLGLRVYREAQQSIEDPRWLAELTARRGWLMVVQEGPRGGLRATDELWSDELSGSPLVAAALVRSAAFARSGRVEEALVTAGRGWQAQQAMTEPFDVHPMVIRDFYVCEALAIAGRIEEWEARAEGCYAEALAERSASMQMFFAYQRGRASLARGRVTTAARLAGEAVGIAHQLQDPLFVLCSLILLAEALALTGDVEGAGRALAEAELVRPMPWMFAEPAHARAWLAVVRGDLVSARRTLEEEVERALSCDDLRAAAQALHSLVRIGDARLASTRLEELADRVEGELVPVQARHAAAVVARDGATLEQVAVQFRDMAAMLLAAEAYCDAAVAFRVSGDPKRSALVSQRARLLLDECEGAETPASQPLGVRTELTPAERKTAMLAAQGQSNRDIAVIEQVSVRTVESRLQCVYSKLGISSRTELSKYLGGARA